MNNLRLLQKLDQLSEAKSGYLLIYPLKKSVDEYNSDNFAGASDVRERARLGL